MKMSKLAAVALAIPLMLSSNARAAGGFDCMSADKKVVVSGMDTSAGTWVTRVVINGKELKQKKDYNDSLYNSARQLSMNLLDGNSDRELVRIETVKSYPAAAGIVWTNGNEEGQVVVCEFTY